MGMHFLFGTSATFPKTKPQEKHTIAATTMQTCPSHQWTLPQSLSIHRFIQVDFLHTVKLSISPHNSLQVPVSPDAVVRRDCPLQLRLLVLEGLCFTPQVPWTNPFGARVSPIRPGPIARSLAMFQSRSCAATAPSSQRWTMCHMSHRSLFSVESTSSHTSDYFITAITMQIASSHGTIACSMHVHDS